MPDTERVMPTYDIERVQRDTANHQMTIAHDHGLYRHLMFRAPTTGMYWFDLITVPGQLIFVGDGDSFVFARLTDMFTFFRPASGWNMSRITPDYWSEKITDGNGRAKRYSERMFRKTVRDRVQEVGAEFPGLAEAVKEALTFEHDAGSEADARRFLDGFEYEVMDDDETRIFRFCDAWEWTLTDWDWWYLWACHAIVSGIAQYDEYKAKQAISPGSDAATGAPEPQVLSWDWRESPRPAEIADAVSAASGGTLTGVEVDTGSDEYVVVLGRAGLDAEEARAVYERSITTPSIVAGREAVSDAG